MILGAPACKAKGTAWAGFYWRGESIGRLSKLSLEGESVVWVRMGTR